MSRLRAHALLAFLVHAGCSSCGPRAQRPAPTASVPAPAYAPMAGPVSVDL